MLVFENRAHRLGLAFAALLQVALRLLRQLLAALLQRRQQVLHVARGGGQQPLLNGRSDLGGLSRSQRLFQQIQGAAFRLAGIGRQGALALNRFPPAGGDRQQFLVQARGLGTVQAQPPQQNHPGNGIATLRQTGPRQVVMDEALGGEPPQQPLRQPMFQMQMHHRVVEGRRGFEHHRPQRRFPPPLPYLLLAGAGHAHGVQGRRPGGVPAQDLGGQSKAG